MGQLLPGVLMHSRGSCMCPQCIILACVLACLQVIPVEEYSFVTTTTVVINGAVGSLAQTVQELRQAVRIEVRLHACMGTRGGRLSCGCATMRALAAELLHLPQ